MLQHEGLGFQEGRRCCSSGCVQPSRMGKKGKKAAAQSAVASIPPAVEEEIIKSGSSKSEIDAIFGEKKRKKPSQEPVKEKESSEVVKLDANGELVRPKKPKSAKSASSKTAPAAMSRKKTEDGFTVYSAEELGFNKKNAGGTSLCPFDCDCCF